MSDCRDGSDEWLEGGAGCGNCSAPGLYQCSYGGTALCRANETFCDGNLDCDLWEDETPTNCPNCPGGPPGLLRSAHTSHSW